MLVHMTIDRAAWPFVAASAAVTVGLALLSPALGVVGAVVTAWCVLFFRDPERVTPARDGLIVSAADGIVSLVDMASPPPELSMNDKLRHRVCVFMNFFDVHVNRIPCDGTLAASVYRPGKFVNAAFDKASEDNERNSIRIVLEDGRDMACVQIAGLVARRIRVDVEQGRAVRAGQRLGLIRFGSRVDHYLPEGVAPLVARGQKMVAGETVIADLRAQEPPRPGEVRW